MRPARRPEDVATRETAAFIRRHVSVGSRLLEVGAGRGEVARWLTEDGLRVIGIDSDPEAVAAAAAAGAPVLLGEWPCGEHAGLDAIVFTRSLHHAYGLDDAVRAAFEALDGSGLLLVEDFAYERADEALAAWLRERALEAVARGVLADPSGLPEGELLATLLSSDHPLEAWRADHDHDLHTFDEMQDSVRRAFGGISVQTVPYLYRYFVPLLPPTREAARQVEHVLALETAAGTSGELALIGRRIVARAGH